MERDERRRADDLDRHWDGVLRGHPDPPRSVRTTIWPSWSSGCTRRTRFLDFFPTGSGPGASSGDGRRSRSRRPRHQAGKWSR